jgi:ferric-dicitrate binding protein FerR (iron transport regulator)
MTFYEQRIRHLLQLFADNKASEQEITEMLSLLRQKEGDRELDSFVKQLRQESDSESSRLQVDWESIWDTIHQSAIQPVTPVRKMKWLRVAAAIIILISMSVFVFTQITVNRKTNDGVVKVEPLDNANNDILPGGDKAILTLANGSQIILDSAANGVVAQQGKTEVMKLANGQLVYKGAGDQENDVLYNTMATPRGGQYRLVLPDGSRVWLNAVSSIRFPTAFTGNERKVEITGEAYFEIVKDEFRPFRVLVKPVSGNDDMEVTVLGTHFNINAYQDEPAIKTTLLEGSVKVTNGTNHTVIKPGQQTQLNINGVIKVIQDADVAEAVAWKDGRFEFNDTDLKTIMRQVMRWYDVDVEYQNNMPDRYFTANISRNKTLSGVLTILKLSDVGFKLEGKKLSVTP